MHYEGNHSCLAFSAHCAMALLLLAVSPALWSAVYQCKGADGSTVFSDSPCGADAKVIIVRPQAPMSNSSAVTKSRAKTSSGSDSQAALNATRDAEALKCQAREYGAWYQAQNPKPTREQSDARMSQIVEGCWLSTHILTAQDNVTVNPVIKTVIRKAPQPIVGSAGTAAPNGPLQVSRSRQPEEAARWSNYYSCRAQAYQDWSNGLGHAPEDAEARDARSRTDNECRAKFGIAAGAAAMLIN